MLYFGNSVILRLSLGGGGVGVDILVGTGGIQKRASPDFLSPVIGITAVMGLYYK